MIPLLLLGVLLLGPLWGGEESSRSVPTSVHSSEGGWVLLTFAGDLMAHNVNYRMEDYDAIYEDVAPLLRRDDLSFVNLETVVRGSAPPSSFPRFSVDPAYVEAAVRAGFDVFSLANNHTCDQGEAGVRSTLKEMARLSSRYGIHYNGAVTRREDRFTVTRMEVKGVRIGFLAVSEFMNEIEGSGLVNLVYFPHEGRRRAFLDFLSRVTPQYDFFVLSVHGGEEYRRVPLEVKRAFFREAVSRGVDVVWSHHPHVLQPWEWIRTPEGRRALVLYSLGNFVSGQTWRLGPSDWEEERAYTGESVLFQVRIRKEGERVVMVPGQVVPVVNVVRKEGERRGVYVVRAFSVLTGRVEVDPPWEEYFRRRYRMFRAWVVGWGLDPVRGGSLPSSGAFR
ncbi:CapA family protein [Spirochaeta thermophila]|nr:CapA family protein [Spirochaeta thermophila]